MLKSTKAYRKAELKTLKQTYFFSKALYETIKEQASEIQSRILAEHPFYKESTETRILKAFDSYLMSESDFNDYLDLCYAEYKKAGIDDKRGREFIPEAESRDLFEFSRNALVEFALDIIPDAMTEKQTLKEAVKNPKYRDKVLELVLRLEC